MRKLSIQWSFLLLAAGFMAVFTSCEEDPVGGDLGPDIGFTASPVDTADEGTTISFTINATTGDADLKTIVLTEEGTAVDIDRVDFEETGGTRASWGANPKSLDFDEFRNGFTWTVYLTVHADAAVSRDYNIRLTDANDEFDDLPFTITTKQNAPVLDFTVAGSMSDIDANANATFTINATKGSADLSTLSIFADDVLISAARVRYELNGEPPIITWDANPYSLDTDDLRDGFMWDGLLTIHSEENTTKMYKVVLTDADGLSDEYNFEVTTKFTTIDVLESEQWWNFNGPNAGCVDLETGKTRLQSQAESAECDLIDSGTDTGGQAGIWKKQFQAENGATVRFPADGTFRPSSYAAIVSEFDASADQGEVNAIMNAWYLARDSDGNYYAFEFTEINETTNDSQDFYKIRILKKKM